MGLDRDCFEGTSLLGCVPVTPQSRTSWAQLPADTTGREVATFAAITGDFSHGHGQIPDGPYGAFSGVNVGRDQLIDADATPQAGRQKATYPARTDF